MHVDHAASARHIATLQWWERLLFEVTGRWAGADGAVPLRLQLSAQSFRHAWRAEQLEPLLPEVRTTEDSAGGWTGWSPTPAHSRLAGHLAAAGPAAGGSLDAGHAAILYEHVLPALASLYWQRLALANPVADGTLVRSLRLLLGDLVEDWQAGNATLWRMRTDGTTAPSVPADAFLTLLSEAVARSAVGSS